MIGLKFKMISLNTYLSCVCDSIVELNSQRGDIHLSPFVCPGADETKDPQTITCRVKYFRPSYFSNIRK